jgi:hypothetical protein
MFWLFIALAGFLVGYELAGLWLSDKPVLLQVAVAFGTGLLGAVLAVVFERVAFSLAGFYAAAYLAVMMIDRVGLASNQTAIIFVVGLVGAVLAAVTMDWAIIVLSALVGATAIVSTLPVPPVIDAALVIFIAAIGIAVQRAVFVRSRTS